MLSVSDFCIRIKMSRVHAHGLGPPPVEDPGPRKIYFELLCICLDFMFNVVFVEVCVKVCRFNFWVVSSDRSGLNLVQSEKALTFQKNLNTQKKF